MKNFELTIVRCTVMVVCSFAPFLALATDYQNPSEVERVVGKIMQQPRPQPASTAIYYADGIAHFDSFIPHTPLLEETYDAAKHHYKYTFHDGRVVKCEALAGSGALGDYCAVWYDASGAPGLTCSFRGDGTCDWYGYAVYNSSGKVQTIYRFNASFELRSYATFSYEGSTTRIQHFNENSEPESETLYETGGVFTIRNGEKRKVNNTTRERGIRALVKFGLKPIYPGY